MANQISLLTYLQNALPAIPTNAPPVPGPNTTNGAYNANDIQTTAVWNGFNLNILLPAFQNLLAQVHLMPDPMPASPPRPITAENALRMRRALRAAFDHLGLANQLNGLTPVSFDVGESAEIIDGFKPDTAYFEVALPAGTGPNRAPGDIKPSWKWNTPMATNLIPGVRKEYRQALSQVNWYMKQHKARYGFLLTDVELVVFRRLRQWQPRACSSNPLHGWWHTNTASVDGNFCTLVPRNDGCT
ncbi:conserved hypothetical protein [Coccidioides posadasii str. Silveira]|uniref:Uncharacterized protein n=1 Tax=Coccidioides posadasii (strain RMSCC 757 / Silveira) TaxID=443226 RepID=E9CSS3_COCPS|nr:conserved hypothetical protein [Coccidioides posadasii str. Silveira]